MNHGENCQKKKLTAMCNIQDDPKVIEKMTNSKTLIIMLFNFFFLL